MCQSIRQNMKTIMYCPCTGHFSVADFIRDNTTLDPALIKSSGRGEYVPVADNTTEEGRARNRRVEIKVYNSYNSDGATE